MVKFREKLMHGVFFVCAMASILAVLLICWFLFSNGLPAMAKIGVFDFLFGIDWSPTNVPPSFGIFPMILGSIYVTAGALLFGVPIGIFSAVYMAKFCPKKLYRVLKPAVELLAGIPSVVYGFFGMIILVPLVRELFGGDGNSILTASILLGIMILPTIISDQRVGPARCAKSYYEGSLALGATHERSVFFTIVPAAKSAIFAAVILGIGRAIGETMAVIMICGQPAPYSG